MIFLCKFIFFYFSSKTKMLKYIKRLILAFVRVLMKTMILSTKKQFNNKIPDSGIHAAYLFLCVNNLLDAYIWKCSLFKSVQL